MQIAIGIQAKTGKLLKNYLPALDTSEEVKVNHPPRMAIITTIV